METESKENCVREQFLTTRDTENTGLFVAQRFDRIEF
jgi:hypothetical protein